MAAGVVRGDGSALPVEHSRHTLYTLGEDGARSQLKVRFKVKRDSPPTGQPVQLPLTWPSALLPNCFLSQLGITGIAQL